MDKEKINQIIKWAKWGLIVVLILLLTRECNKIVDGVKPSKPKADTLVFTKVNTIYRKDTIVRFKPKTSFVYIHDTIIKPIEVSNSDCNTVKLSIDSVSNKEVTIFDSTYIQGIIRKQSISYKLKVPLEVVRSTTTTINNPVLYPPNYELHLGLQVSFKDITPVIDLSIKRHNITLGYNIQSKQPVVGYKFTIFRK